MTRDLERRVSRLENPGGNDAGSVIGLAEWMEAARRAAESRPPETREERRQRFAASIAELEAAEQAGTLPPLGQRMLDANRRMLRELDEGEAA